MVRCSLRQAKSNARDVPPFNTPISAARLGAIPASDSRRTTDRACPRIRIVSRTLSKRERSAVRLSDVEPASDESKLNGRMPARSSHPFSTSNRYSDERKRYQHRRDSSFAATITSVVSSPAAITPGTKSATKVSGRFFDNSRESWDSSGANAANDKGAVDL